MDNNSEISIIQLFKVAFGNKRRIVFFTGIVLILGALFFWIIYNPGKSKYVAEFNYFVQGLNAGQYIDGSAFKYEEIVSYDSLKKVKESDSEFSNIDIDGMINNNNIRIEFVQEAAAKEVQGKSFYRLSVKSSFFDDKEQAKKFIQSLVRGPIEKTVEMSNTDRYKYNLKIFDECESFELQLGYLEAQFNLLGDKYDELINYYGDITLTDKETITDKKKKMNVYFYNNSFSYLKFEKEEKGYVLNKGDNVKNLQLTKADYEKQLKYNNLELEMLEKSISSLVGNIGTDLQSAEINSYNSRITGLISENVELTRQIDIIDLQLTNINNKGNDEFAKKLEETKQILNGYTDYYQAVEYQVLLNESKVYFTEGSIISEQGRIGMLTGGIILVVIGIMVSCCFNLIVGWREVFKDPFAEEEKKAARELKKARVARK